MNDRHAISRNAPARKRTAGDVTSSVDEIDKAFAEHEAQKANATLQPE
jgi:hypothetical protein